MIERYEYGIFNADKDKILSANDWEDKPENEWIWNSPIEIRLSEEEAYILVDKLNMEREEDGILDSHGPVKARRRRVQYFEWE